MRTLGQVAKFRWPIGDPATLMERAPTAPVLIVNPASDWQLAGQARELANEGRWTPETLQAELRLTFPRLVVRSRDLSGEPTPTWYVYREGRWISSEPLD